MRCTAFWTAVLGLATSVAALDPVEVYGNKFFNKDGSQFFMKGEILEFIYNIYLLMVTRRCVPTCS